VLFGILAWKLYVKCVKEHYQASLVTVFLLFFSAMLYWIERVGAKHYDFHLLTDWSWLRIAQTDPIFLLVPATAIALSRNYSISRKFVPGRTFLLQDLPITDINADELNRSQFYTDVVARLKAISFDSTRSFSIGINSTWGYGKTSLLNIIRKNLEEPGSNIVCILYNPWLSANRTTLTIDFFAALEYELSKYISNTNILFDYAKRVSKVDNDDNKLKGWMEVVEGKETLHERFDEIGELIRYTGKKFVVIIDDLDRLDNDEVFEVLRLVRNVANFPRLTYIAAYDKFYLVNALRSKRIRLPDQYLEKIFELEIELPKIDLHRIRDILHTTVKNGFAYLTLDQNEQTNFELQLLNMIYNPGQLPNAKISAMANHIDSIFRSKRDILKFANSFMLSLSLNKDLLFLPDLFILEALKLHNSELYQLLVASDKYLDLNNSGSVPMFQLYELSGRTMPIETANAGRLGLFDILPNIKPFNQQELVKALFTQPEVGEWKANKSIVMAYNFRTYFIFAEPQGVVAANEVNQLLNP
jgi:hypothetical protein